MARLEGALANSCLGLCPRALPRALPELLFGESAARAVCKSLVTVPHHPLSAACELTRAHERMADVAMRSAITSRMRTPSTRIKIRALGFDWLKE